MDLAKEHVNAYNYSHYEQMTIRDMLSDSGIIRNGVKYSTDEIYDIANDLPLKYYDDLYASIEKELKSNSLIDRYIEKTESGRWKLTPRKHEKGMLYSRNGSIAIPEHQISRVSVGR